MKSPLRILHLEDKARDKELIRSALEAEGLDCQIVNVKSREQFEHALTTEQFDVVLSDYALPDYDGFSALEFLRRHAPTIPFILLSGTLGEERAVECLKTGATDYILKERLNRLVPAIKRAVHEAEERAQRKQLDDHLRQAQKMEAIGQLAGGIAHDFNNILGCIVGYTELALLEASNPMAVEENLEEVLKASQRAKELVLQILTFSRQQEQERKPIRLQPVIKEALKLLRASLPSTIEVHSDIATDYAAVLADGTQIHQVIMNLATNAAHAMSGRPGQLRVSLTTADLRDNAGAVHADLRAGRYFKLSVSDTGCGMDASTLQRIFEPFFTTKPPGEGTGLGLAVVHGIMKSHDGAITVESQPGKGTTFHLYFPVYGGAASETQLQTGSVPGGQGQRVLFIDDEPPLAFLGRKLLERAGYTVTIQTNSVEALAAFRSNPAAYDLVITDLTMPNLTGADLASELLKLRPNLPIVLTTGFTGAMNSAKAQALGVRELVLKPLNGRSLAEAAHRALAEGKDN